MAVVYKGEDGLWRYGSGFVQNLSSDTLCVNQAVAVKLQLAMADVGARYTFTIEAAASDPLAAPVVQNVKKV